ncbi:hypothetical protein MOQ_004598 [Trypanosoma cruzi marinkellei]|uniref:Uncharacterized protein n=1 Tax=Trypanosoma cruzi marinkellei TaxID=85056 RepID=K2NRI4_TRYCR|nr:hypothetical protein MOQ_004598 [Trypanosoma cruzi marinkellei]
MDIFAVVAILGRGLQPRGEGDLPGAEVSREDARLPHVEFCQQHNKANEMGGVANMVKCLEDPFLRAPWVDGGGKHKNIFLLLYFIFRFLFFGFSNFLFDGSSFVRLLPLRFRTLWSLPPPPRQRVPQSSSQKQEKTCIHGVNRSRNNKRKDKREIIFRGGSSTSRGVTHITAASYIPPARPQQRREGPWRHVLMLSTCNSRSVPPIVVWPS